jgi:hypothetical protein
MNLTLGHILKQLLGKPGGHVEENRVVVVPFLIGVEVGRHVKPVAYEVVHLKSTGHTWSYLDFE